MLKRPSLLLLLLALFVCVAEAQAPPAQYPIMDAVAQKIGAIYATLPAGAVHTTINGTEYFVSNGEWFLPSAGANGVLPEIGNAFLSL